MNFARKLSLRAKHRFRLSGLSRSYWNRRVDAIRATGSFSQHGEDRVLLEKCGKSGFYIDIGANHPFLISNTYMLYMEGWRGITVEPIRSLWKMHRQWRPDDLAVNAAIGDGEALEFFEMYPDVLSTLSRKTAEDIEKQNSGIIIAEYSVPMITGAELVEKYVGTKQVDLLSIDVEGAEMGVLSSFDFDKFSPRYILIEHQNFINTGIEKDRLDTIENLGYVLDETLGANSLFKRVHPVSGSEG